MAVLQRQQLGIREIGETVSVPDSPVARAMFYLKCICSVLDLNEGNSNLQRFTDYRNYFLLTEGEIDGLTSLFLSVKPEELLGICLIPNEELCRNSNNTFFELEDMRQNMVIADNIIIAGQQRRVNRIMYFKMAWLQLYYVNPLHFLGDRLKRRVAEARNARRAITYPSPHTYDHTTSSCCTIL